MKFLNYDSFWRTSKVPKPLFFIGWNRFREDALKNGLQKRGPKNVSAEQALYKNVPLGGPQINPRPFLRPPNVGKRSVSRKRWFRQNAHFALVSRFGPHPADQIFSRFFGFFKGWPKNREKTVFFGCLICVVFLYRLLMVTCRLDIPSCLQMFHSSLLSYFWCYVFLLSGGCVSFFLFIFIFLVFITFHLVVCLCCRLSWWDRNPDQITKYLKFWLSSSASVPASPHFHLAQIITLLGQEKNLSKNLFFVAFMLGLLAMCWNTYFYCVLYTSSKICLQNGPQEKR